MNAVVIYASHFGNTQKVAEAMAARLRPWGNVQLFAADHAPEPLPEGTDLLIVGGPTEAFRMTAPMARFLDRLAPWSLHGVAAAAFDTRVAPRWWMLGYAGNSISKRLERLGARIIAHPEGFLVEGSINEAEGKYPSVMAGELERAADWAASLSGQVAMELQALVGV